MQVDLYLVGMSVAILAVVPVDIALNIVLAVVEDHNCYNTVADNRAVADGSTAEPDAEAVVAPEWDY